MASYKALATADLARSGISPEAASFAGIGAVADASTICPDYAPVAALVLPYATIDGTPVGSPPFARVRYLEDPPARGGDNPFKKPKPQRYAQPPKSNVHAYFPHTERVSWREVAADPTWPLVIVEGEKKALAATLAGFATVGFGGVYNFYHDGELLPELEAFEWKGRPTFICYDSDAAHNPQIQAAEARLATELSLRRGAVLHLVRLPNLPGGDKQGLDDLLVSQGPDTLEGLLTSAPRMRKVDAAVVSLNEHVAWIEKEGQVYDLRSKEFMQKANFTNGSSYSALEILAPTAKGTGVKRISVSESWLKHPHAQRYDYVEFRPEEAPVIGTNAGGLALNMWTGWEPEPGDVQPFLDLTAHLMQDLREHADLPIKLLAYKAQNPGQKIPLCPVLVGPQGCGKSLWAECVREAFSPYTAEVPATALAAQFNGWVEKTLVGVINEASSEHLHRYAPQLRALISDKRVMLNEKFRVARQIDSYTLYIITSNDRGAGAYSADDRRMIVVSCPKKREQAFYERVARWKNSARGGKALLHYLLNLDLKGWRPPAAAPLTSEKYMAYMESLSPIQRLAEEMMSANYHVVVLWIQQALAWASSAELSNNPVQARQAREIIDSLQTIQIRPWYTPEELALMFPAIVSQLHGTRQTARASGEISKELRTAGIGYLRSSDDPRGFRWRGMVRQYLIVADHDEWEGVDLSQAEFDRLMKQFPDYGDGARYATP